jgi:hypothetical protein
MDRPCSAPGPCHRQLVEKITALLPEGQAVYLRDRGITELPLYGLNAILEKHSLLIQTRKVRSPKRFVACTDKNGRSEPFGLFILESPDE